MRKKHLDEILILRQLEDRKYHQTDNIAQCAYNINISRCAWLLRGLRQSGLVTSRKFDGDHYTSWCITGKGFVYITTGELVPDEMKTNLEVYEQHSYRHPSRRKPRLPKIMLRRRR